MKNSAHQLQARLVKGLPVNLSELDKKYARKISKPLVRWVGELTKRLHRLLEKDARKQNQKAAKAGVSLLAEKARQLANTFDFK